VPAKGDGGVARRLAAVKRSGSMHMFSEHGLLGGYAFVAEGIPLPLVPQNKWREALKRRKR